MEFIPGVQGKFNIYKSIVVTNFIIGIYFLKSYAYINKFI